jgi:DNA-binding response OmpR family regulator
MGTMPGDLKGTHVAVVENDALLRESLCVYLRVMGSRVEAFASAEEVRDAGNLGRFDVMISDIHLPGEGGFSLLRKVREASTAVVTILITLQSTTDLAREASAAGIDGVLAKPFRTEELEGVLLRLTGKGIGGSQAVLEAVT